jgi:hypothetical protein
VGPSRASRWRPLQPAGLGQYFVLDLKPEGLPVRAGVRRPASVLIATHRVVPFENMPGLGAEFVQWATGVPTHSQGSPVLARVVHAAAGLGKTRALDRGR